MKVGDKFEVHGLTFTVRRVVGRDRYIVEDANGELDAVEGPDQHGRFAVLIPTVRLRLAAHLEEG